MIIMPSTLDRRRLLAGGSGLILLSGIAPGRLLAQSKFGGDPFSLGVAAGDPLPDGFVIWTRLAPKPRDPHGGMPIRPVKVEWEVAEDEHFTRLARAGTAVAHPDLAHSVHVEVSGLQPRRPYWYRFAIKRGERSSVGMARTAPAPGDLPERVRIAVAGCQNYEAGFFGAYGHLAQESDLDAIFHYGDYIYVGAGGRGAKVNGTQERVVVRANSGKKVASLDDFRVRYAEYKLDPDLQAAHHAAAFICSYDDGEVSDAFAGDYDKVGTPPEIFALHRFAAMQAWYEHMPVRRAQFPRLSGLNAVRRLDYGKLLRMHVLDTRAHRTSPPCIGPEDEGCGWQPDVPPTVLGKEQERWLGEGLVNEARWNMLAQQILVMPFNSGGANDGRIKVGWNPYPEARARLVRQIMERRLTNVVIASGDAHQHFIGTVPVRDEAPDGAAAATEFLTTSISSAGDGTPLRPESEQLLRHTPNLAFINAKRGYQLFNIGPQEWRSDVKIMDRVQTRGGSLHTEATFVVEPARPGAHKG